MLTAMMMLMICQHPRNATLALALALGETVTVSVTHVIGIDYQHLTSHAVAALAALAVRRRHFPPLSWLSQIRAAMTSPPRSPLHAHIRHKT